MKLTCPLAKVKTHPLQTAYCYVIRKLLKFAKYKTLSPTVNRFVIPQLLLKQMHGNMEVEFSHHEDGQETDETKEKSCRAPIPALKACKIRGLSDLWSVKTDARIGV